MTSAIAAARDLAAATHPQDLVPLDAAAADAAARRLRSMASTLAEAHHEVRDLESLDGWKGDAGRSFERRMAKLPDHTEGGAAVFEAAGRSFADLAQTVTHARSEAFAAFDLWQLAHEQSRRWHADLTAASDAGDAMPGLPRTDPGAASAERAIALYRDARSRMDDAADRAVRTLALAAEVAPGARAFLAPQGAFESIGGFARGVGDFAGSAVRFFVDFNPIRAALDPEGFVGDVTDTAGGMAHLLRNPGDIDDVFLDLELLREDPARWLGNFLAPTILLAPLSLGASTGLHVSHKLVTRLGPGGRLVARHLDDIDHIATRLRLPSFQSMARLGEPSVRQRMLDNARRIPPEPEELEAYATEHGGRADDYEKKRATVVFAGDHDLTFEFVHNIRTDQTFDPRVLSSDIALDSCTE